MRKSWRWLLQKLILMLWIFYQKRKNNEKLDCQKRKHRCQYNSTISLNNSKYTKDVFIYLTCEWRLWQINIREMFTEVINMCYRQRRAIFIDFDLDRVTKKAKFMYFTEAMKLFAFRPQHFVIWAQASAYEEFIIPR